MASMLRDVTLIVDMTFLARRIARYVRSELPGAILVVMERVARQARKFTTLEASRRLDIVQFSPCDANDTIDPEAVAQEARAFRSHVLGNHLTLFPFATVRVEDQSAVRFEFVAGKKVVPMPLPLIGFGIGQD